MELFEVKSILNMSSDCALYFDNFIVAATKDEIIQFVDSEEIQRVQVGKVEQISIQKDKLFVKSESLMIFDGNLNKISEIPCSAFCITDRITCAVGFFILEYNFNGKLISKQKIDHQIKVLQRVGSMVCACADMYFIIDMKTLKQTPLFPTENTPIIVTIDDYFLIVTASSQNFGMGIYINAQGEPIKGTLQFHSVPSKIVYANGYLISMLDKIVIHNTATQELIQQFDISGYLNDLCVCTKDGIFYITLTSIENQLDQLLQHDITAAINLLESEDDAALYYQAISTFYKTKKYSLALPYLKKLAFDPKILLGAYGYLPKTSEFVDIPPEEGLSELVDYLEYCERDSVVDTALVKLYTKMSQSDKLLNHLPNSKCKIEAVEELLRENQIFALSILYKHRNMPQKALDIWKGISEGDYSDAYFGGMPLIIEYLTELNDKNLVLKYGSWVLRRDVRGIKIFTERTTSLFTLEEEKDFIYGFGSAVRIEYLEYICPVRKDKELNTDLSILYLNEIMKMKSSLDSLYDNKCTFMEFLEARRCPLSLGRLKFVKFIRTNAVNVKVLQEELLNTNLLLEKLELAKLSKEHGIVMKLGLEMGDWISTEKYAKQNGLEQELLEWYIHPQRYSSFTRFDYTKQFMNLIIKNDLEILPILSKIPSNWSLQALGPVLQREILRLKRNKKIESTRLSLTKGLNLQLHQESLKGQVTKPKILLDRYVTCVFCGEGNINPNSFTVVEGEILHSHCI